MVKPTPQRRETASIRGHVAPAGRCPAESHRREYEAEDTDRLAEEQTEGDAEGHRIEEHPGGEPRQGYAGIGEPGQRQHEKRRPRMRGKFEPVQDRPGRRC